MEIRAFSVLIGVLVFASDTLANLSELNVDALSEQKLIERLFKNYNKKVRPPGTVQIKFSLNLNQIVNLMEKDQIVVLNAFVDHEWTDNRLSWDPAEYNNLSLIRVSGDMIWTPDTFIYTTADQSGFLLPQSGAYFVINNGGLIFWPNPLTQMRVRCRMTILWFPFDEQLCIIVFGSWSYTFHYLNYSLMNENTSLENYTEHNEWTLKDYRSFRHEIKYTNWIENDTFSEIRYKMLIQRKPLFVIQNCVIPAIMLCILTLASFFIPFAQEMQIGISIMLAFSVFKLRLSDDVPVQSDSVPLVNIYFTICMTFSLAAMIWFSMINLMRENKRAPGFIRHIVLNYICYIMCSKYSNSSACSPVKQIRKSSRDALAIDKAGGGGGAGSDQEPYTQLVTTVKSPPNSSNADTKLLKKPSGTYSYVKSSNNNLLSLLEANQPATAAKLSVSSNQAIQNSPRISVSMARLQPQTETEANTLMNKNAANSALWRKKNEFYISNERNSKKKKYSVDSKFKNASEFEFENELDRMRESKGYFLNDYDDINVECEFSGGSSEDEDEASNLVWLPRIKRPPSQTDNKSIKSKYLYIDQTIETKFDSEVLSNSPSKRNADSSNKTRAGESSPSLKSTRSDKLKTATAPADGPLATTESIYSTSIKRDNNKEVKYSLVSANSIGLNNVVLLRNKRINRQRLMTPSASSHQHVNNQMVAQHHQASASSPVTVKKTSSSGGEVNMRRVSTRSDRVQSSSTSDVLSDLAIIHILNVFMFYVFLIFALLLNLISLYLLPYHFRTPLEITED